MPQSRIARLLVSLFLIAAACTVGFNLYHRYLNTALFDAVKAKNVAAVRALLHRGADANMHRATMGNRRVGTSVLSLVITPFRRPEVSEEEIACLLIEHGANIREKPGRWTYLENACRSGSIKTVRCLLDRGSQFNFTSSNRSIPIRNAIDFGNDRVYVSVRREDQAEKKDRYRVSREIVRLLKAHGARLTVHQAAELEDMPELASRLGAGLPADELEGNRPTALCVAASRGQTAMLRLLLKHGADANHLGPVGTTPLCYAAENGKLEAAELLLAHGARVNLDGNNETPLEAAVWGKNARIVRLLLERGANPNLRRTGGAPPFALREAILSLPEVVPDLLAHGADVDTANGEPLMAALNSNRPDLVRDLLRRGAHLRFTPKTEERNSIYMIRLPYQPLIAAVLHSPECKDMLLEAGADINGRDLYGYTALTTAVTYAPKEVKYLLDHGARVDIMTQAKRMPLDLAAAHGSLENVRLLLAHGADVNACPPRGHTALYWARKHDHLAVIAMLEKAGGRSSE